jgi:hypothetical protein
VVLYLLVGMVATVPYTAWRKRLHRNVTDALPQNGQTVRQLQGKQ